MMSSVSHDQAASNSQEIFGWKMYDWAWSAFSTTVTTALLGPYLFELAEENGGVDVLGLNVDSASFFPFCVSLSVVLQVIILPIVGAIADTSNQKKQLMMSLAYLAGAVTAGLFLVTGSTVVLGGVLFVIAGVAIGASSVVYNSYLPQLVAPKDRDRVSSQGFSYGYLGGGLWLAVNFGLIAIMDDAALAVRISLGSTGLWLLFFFSLFPGRLIKDRPASRQRTPGTHLLAFSFGDLWATLTEMRRKYPVTARYLIAYLIFNDGILTVIVVATSFAADELDAESATLLQLVLMIQFVAIVGALGFARFAQRVGVKATLTMNLAIWCGVVVYAYLLLNSIVQLWILGVFVALLLGGSQALARSLFTQLLPPNKEASYFGFFEIASRGTSWIGPFTFGVLNQITGSQRQAILVLIVFFAVGLALLIPIDIKKGMETAGQNSSGLKI